MAISDEMILAIEDELKKQVDCITRQPGMFDLRRMMAYHMGWEGEGAGPEARGKRIRPLLVTLCDAANGADWRLALPAAVGVELVHNFSLLHDDIEDNSPLRRGRPTVWKMWGIPQAINTGDAMFALAHLSIYQLDSSLPCDRILESSKLLQKTCLELTQGQFLDISYEDQPKLSFESYWQMVSGKTAVLVACSCEMGALIGGADPARCKQYYQFGLNLGLAFQVMDDILGVWGDAQTTGKSIQSDLVTGKKSLPILFGLNQNGEFSARWADGKVTEEDVSVASRILKDEGAQGFSLGKASEFTQEALSALAKAEPAGIAGQELIHLTKTLLGREN